MAGNTFLTPTIIADVGLLALENNLVMANLVYRGYDKEFRKIGDTARVRKPATFTAIEFDGDLSGEFQDISESYVDVKLDKILTVPFEITQEQMSLDVKDLTEQVINPAARALAQGIDSLLTGLYVDIPYYTDVSGTVDVSDISDVRKILLENKVPMDDQKSGVLCPDTEAKYNVLDAFLHADKRGDTTTVKSGSMGRLYGIDWYVDQNIKTHTVGTVDLAGAITDDPSVAAGATTIHVGSLGTGTINKGSIITIAGNTGKYVVTANATIAANAATLTIYPALNDAVLKDAVVTIHAADKANLVFHKNAFCLATAPLAEPLGGADASTKTYKGLSLQVVFSWNHNAMKNVGTMSILCGVKTLQPELAVRFCG
jgi:hypothetical protein